MEESEERLQLFIEQLSKRGFGEKVFQMKDSAKALATFLNLNLFILNMKKVRFSSLFRIYFFVNKVSLNYSFRLEMPKLLVKLSRNTLNKLLFLYYCLLLTPCQHRVPTSLLLWLPIRRLALSHELSSKLLERG